MSNKKKTPAKSRAKKLVLPANIADTLDDLCNEGVIELHNLMRFNSPNAVIAAVQAKIAPEVKRLTQKRDDVIKRLEAKIKSLQTKTFLSDDDEDEDEDY